jgi:predicted nucleotidyltransferase component of viral defense system
MNQIYLDTARLLVQVAPFVFADPMFALKGGTAINLFVRDMPRLSVDLDLVYTEYREPREQALSRINQSIQHAAEVLVKRGFQTRTVASVDAGETKLLIRRGNVEVKVEVNFNMRGTLKPTHTASLTAKARDTLLADIEIPVVSLEDLYGGKLVAAMDRQHPRDLFDVMQLFANEGVTPGVRRAFVVYLACHNRPVHEVLFPAMRDIREDFERNFAGMSSEPIALSDLLAVRERLVRELQTGLDANERQFLMSLVNNAPDWSLMDTPHLEALPSIRWKVRNLAALEKTNPAKFRAQAKALADLLS